MEKRRLKVLFGKSGSVSLSPKICLPIGWVKSLGVTQENRDVTVLYDEEKQEIVIRKGN